MQTATGVLNHPSQMSAFNALSSKKSAPGWISRVFGCWHREMSRPFSGNGQTYRSCLHCGARRQFNLDRWEMQGGYYYGTPSTKLTPNAVGFKIRPGLKLVTE